MFEGAYFFKKTLNFKKEKDRERFKTTVHLHGGLLNFLDCLSANNENETRKTELINQIRHSKPLLSYFAEEALSLDFYERYPELANPMLVLLGHSEEQPKASSQRCSVM